MQSTGDIRCRFLRLEPFLDERGRRLFAANEALSFGRGGVSAVSSATGIARSTINRGIAELQTSHENETRIRRPGAGRRRAEASQPGLLEAIETLVDDAIRGDPEATPRRKAALSGRLRRKNWLAISKTQARSYAPRGIRSRFASTISKSKSWGRWLPMGSTISPPTRAG